MKTAIGIVLGMWVGCGSVFGAEKSISMLLEEAQYQEETVGDVNSAMSIYEKILEDDAARRPEVAKAMYRYGLCLAKKGEKEKAADLFKQVVEKYGDQKIFAMKAQRELEKLGIDAKLLTIVGKWTSVDCVEEPESFEPGVKKYANEFFLKGATFNPDGSSSISGQRWKGNNIIHTESRKSAQYFLEEIDGERYLFLPWMSGDVTLRGEKPRYYVLKSAEKAKKVQIPNSHDKEVVKGIMAAQAWLVLVDAGEYGKSWEEGAVLFKAVVKKADLEKSLAAARKPLGAVKSRDVDSTTYTKTVPGAPDGEYVIIKFKTSFENKADAVETITPMLDKDGKWRVSGYYIK